jgi:hypothetical protein
MPVFIRMRLAGAVPPISTAFRAAPLRGVASSGRGSAENRTRYFFFEALPRKVFTTSGFTSACGTWQVVH